MVPAFRPLAVVLNCRGRDRGHFVTCNRLFRLVMRLRGSSPAAQSYVGKRPTSKGIGGGIRRFVMATCAPGRQRRGSMLPGGGNREAGRRRIHGRHRGSSELPMLPQSALIPFAGDPGRSEMMTRDQTTKFRNSSALFLPGSLAPALPTPALCWIDVDLASIPSPSGRSKFSAADFQLPGTLGLVRRLKCGRGGVVNNSTAISSLTTLSGTGEEND